ncbi:hypothetical protein [uncultured Thiodictyon sp.]|jgi:hypothetical protein|uniref:hypothetical protein n=1 Tax=uncultured Thiodictyon sp. TaxID=1846217 RepID=UPI0025FD1D39|nr:hypothetical protein [uncultured Thiodictyon sp.]
MAACETWFGRAGGEGARELAALRLLGFFDRPAEAGCLAALRQAPPMAGLTEPLFVGAKRFLGLGTSRARVPGGVAAAGVRGGLS